MDMDDAAAVVGAVIEPAALLLREDPRNGMGRPCGSSRTFPCSSISGAASSSLSEPEKAEREGPGTCSWDCGSWRNVSG